MRQRKRVPAHSAAIMPKGGKQRERERAREAEEKEKQAMLNFDSPQERDAAEKHASKIQAIIRGRAARNPTAVALRNAWDEVDTGALGVLDRQGLHRVFDKMFDRPKMTTEEFLQATKAIATVGPKKDSFIFNDVRLWVIARKDSNVQSVVMQVCPVTPSPARPFPPPASPAHLGNS